MTQLNSKETKTCNKKLYCGQIEAAVVAILTMVSSTIYIAKLSQWISHENIRPILRDLLSIEDKEQVKRIFDVTVSLSLAGNALSFLTSLPIFMVVSKDFNGNRRWKNALLPYIFCHVILCVTSGNRLLLMVLMSYDSMTLDIITIRVFDVITLFLSVTLVSFYFCELTKSKETDERKCDKNIAYCQFENDREVDNNNAEKKQIPDEDGDDDDRKLLVV